jgi:hypothetical protein
MKKLTACLIGCVLSASFALADEPSTVDQKWLKAIETMVTKGEKKVTTSKDERVALVKDWAAKNGYSVKVTKSGNCFSLEFQSKQANKTIAQK